MSVTIDQIYTEAMLLPNDSKAFLAEKLVESIETTVEWDIEKLHIAQAKRRRDEIRQGKVQAIPGKEALAKVRATIKNEICLSS